MSNNYPNVWVLDDGYGDNKCSTGYKDFIVPSNYTNWRPMNKGDFGSKYENALDYISVEFNGGKYLVGKSAMKQGDSHWYGGSNKHDDPSFKIFLNTCLGLMANSPQEEVDLLVMGLPVESEQEGRRHALLDSLVVRDHQMKLTLGDGSEFVREVCVKNLIVKKQPFGSLCDVMLDSEGNIIEKDIAKGFNVVVDIGSRTLNVYTLDNLEPINNLCFHTNDGMYTSYMAVNEYIQHKLNHSVPTGKLPMVIEDKSIRDIDLSPVIDKSFEMLAYEIKKVLETKFINSWAMVNRLLITGGGAELLKPYLSNMLMDKEIIFLDRFANARGLRKYGMRQIGKMETKTKQENGGISVKVGNNVY